MSDDDRIARLQTYLFTLHAMAKADHELTMRIADVIQVLDARLTALESRPRVSFSNN